MNKMNYSVSPYCSLKMLGYKFLKAALDAINTKQLGSKSEKMNQMTMLQEGESFLFDPHPQDAHHTTFYILKWKLCLPQWVDSHVKCSKHNLIIHQEKVKWNIYILNMLRSGDAKVDPLAHWHR